MSVSDLSVEEPAIESTEDEVEEVAKSDTEQMREYVEKVATTQR